MNIKNNSCRMLIAMQNAMLGEISCALRAVALDWSEKRVDFICYYHGEVSDDDLDSAGVMDSEMYVNLDEKYDVSHSIRRLDYPEVIPDRGIRVYHRREYT